ncbi:hypothetical protein BSLA_01f2422 [Burkholderia stabilis]|nr:hypothetical protein BSLA_01f2422 [Burkholderia stabilis]
MRRPPSYREHAARTRAMRDAAKASRIAASGREKEILTKVLT